jgi:hypothetical protein
VQRRARWRCTLALRTVDKVGGEGETVHTHVTEHCLGFIVLSKAVECFGCACHRSSHARRVLFGQPLQNRPPRLGQPQLHGPAEVLLARRALPPAVKDTLPKHPMDCLLCPALDVRKPRVAAARTPRLDRRWVVIEADDARLLGPSTRHATVTHAWMMSCWCVRVSVVTNAWHQADHAAPIDRTVRVRICRFGGDK